MKQPPLLDLYMSIEIRVLAILDPTKLGIEATRKPLELFNTLSDHSRQLIAQLRGVIQLGDRPLNIPLRSGKVSYCMELK